MTKTRVLIIDDSALMRNLLKDILSSDPEIEVVATASDPYMGWEQIKLTKPDVITLDVEMPRMDGVSFLGRLMAARPTPVVMISSLTERGCATTLQALELGAVDFVTKPKLDMKHGTALLADEILAKVKGARTAVPRPRPGLAAAQPVAKKANTEAMAKTTDMVIAIGASTGGTEAVKDVLTQLPADCHGIVITQHMPPTFTKSFADRLNGLCQIDVKEAVDGDRIRPGLALIAPGGFQMEITRSGAVYSVKVFDGEPVNRHKPSVDVLFDSVARYAGSNAIGVILTGMGGDGGAGMKKMHDAGAHTIAQDEKTSVVFGMPKVAIEKGGVDVILPLDRIASHMMSHLSKV